MGLEETMPSDALDKTAQEGYEATRDMIPKDERREWTREDVEVAVHERRAKSPDHVDWTIEKVVEELRRIGAYQPYEDLQREGLEFMGKVYPDFQDYLESRREEDEFVEPTSVIEDFLVGDDLDESVFEEWGIDRETFASLE